jgi:hypothetical protein
VFRADNQTSGKQAAHTSLLNQLVLEVYLAAWTRTATQDEQRLRPIVGPNEVSDDPDGVLLDLNRVIFIARGVELDYGAAIAELRRRRLPIAARRHSLWHVSYLRLAGLDQLCFDAELVAGVRGPGRSVRTVERQHRASAFRRALILTRVVAPARTEGLRCVSASLDETRPSCDYLRQLDRRRQSHSRQHRASNSTGPTGRKHLTGSPRRDHIGPVCYTRSLSLAGQPTNYWKGG